MIQDISQLLFILNNEAHTTILQCISQVKEQLLARVQSLH